MNKKIIIVVAVAAVLVVGVFVLTMGKGRKTSDGDMVSTQKESPPESFTGSLKEAAALNIPMKCKYTVDGAEFESTINGRNFKGNVSTPEGNTGNILMIDTCMYSWEDGQAQGLKICYGTQDKDLWESGSTENLADSYVCTPANVPDSEFELPKGMEFLDMNSFMQDVSAIPEEE